MASPQAYDFVAEAAGNQEAYNSINLMDLSLEQSIRLIQLHKMHKSKEDMLRLSTELKQRHSQVQELHKLLQLINKATDQTPGDNLGSLKLTHKKMNDPDVKFAADLTKKLKAHSKPVLNEKGEKTTRIDLTGDDARELLDLLQDAKNRGMNSAVKDTYEGDEVKELYTAIQGLSKIKSAEEWGKVQDIIEIRQRLQEARDVYHIDFKWPVDEYSREERDTLIAAIDMTSKDLGLQNDMQMQDLNRAYQERLEILQMARAILKVLNDDIVHKARSSGAR